MHWHKGLAEAAFGHVGMLLLQAGAMLAPTAVRTGRQPDVLALFCAESGAQALLAVRTAHSGADYPLASDWRAQALLAALTVVTEERDLYLDAAHGGICVPGTW